VSPLAVWIINANAPMLTHQIARALTDYDATLDMSNETLGRSTRSQQVPCYLLHLITFRSSGLCYGSSTTAQNSIDSSHSGLS
jgi:hypothetical protein